MEQETHPVALDVLAKFTPEAHDKQLASIVALPRLAVYVPAAHTVQVLAAADPPAQNEPAGHATYAFPFQYWPTGAALPPEEARGHDELPAAEEVPVAHAVHTLDPAVAA